MDPDLQKRIAAIQASIATAQGKAEELVGNDRSAIAKKIIFLYSSAIVLTFAFVLYVMVMKTPCAGSQVASCTPWKEQADFLAQIISTSILPVVTLVLGFYFGASKVEPKSS